MVQPLSMALRFGDFELDEQRFQLRLGDRRLAIRPKVFDLLVLLVRSRERVVVRNELVMALWGTTAVGPGSLSGLVNELRQVLGEDGRDASSIRTVHARGYQFVASVESDEASHSSDPTQSSDRMEVRMRDLFGSAPGSIRACFGAALCSGARAALATGVAGTDWSVLHEWASQALGSAGFEILRARHPIEVNGSGVAFVDRLLEALVDRYAIGSLRSMIPVRSNELFERCSKRPGPRRFDALAARQYEGRIQRGAAELLTALSRERPVAFLFEATDFAAEDPTSVLLPLLNLLEDSRVFMLGTTRASVWNDELRRAGVSSDSRIEWVECRTESRSNPPLEECNRLNVFLQNCGVEVLPHALADGLVAHLRADEKALQSLAIWLSSQVQTGSRQVHGPAVLVGTSRMRRVESGNAAGRASVGRR